ncbi:unnamed protein product [Orchesella dallaii]|uniref:Gustatory receptor n=1 Tax=Orchesella dallaii TaxID=48710 RepID=A0ABP1Q7P2_9HEXA
MSTDTSSCSRAFPLCTKSFRYCPKMVMEWCPTKKSLVTRGASSHEYLHWYFNILVVICIIGFGSSAYVVLDASNLSIDRVVLAAMLGSVSVFVWTSSYLLTKNIDDLLLGVQATRSLKKQIEERYFSTTINLNLDKYWEAVSEILCISVAILAIIPMILPGLGIYAELDPFFCTFYKLVPTHIICGDDKVCTYFTNFIILFARIIVVIICVSESCRFCAFYLSFIGFKFELTSKTLGVISNIPLTVSQELNIYSDFFKYYNALRLVDQSANEAISQLLAFLLGCGFVVFLICNMITLKCFHTMPIHVYWLAPTVSLICLFLMFFLIPLIININRESIKLGERRRKMLAFSKCWGARRKLMQLRMKCFYPISFKCGNIKMETGLDRMYFYGIFLRTLDCLLLPIF